MYSHITLQVKVSWAMCGMQLGVVILYTMRHHLTFHLCKYCSGVVWWWQQECCHTETRQFGRKPLPGSLSVRGSALPPYRGRGLYSGQEGNPVFVCWNMYVFICVWECVCVCSCSTYTCPYVNIYMLPARSSTPDLHPYLLSLVKVHSVWLSNTQTLFELFCGKAELRFLDSKMYHFPFSGDLQLH